MELLRPITSRVERVRQVAVKALENFLAEEDLESLGKEIDRIARDRAQLTYGDDCLDPDSLITHERAGVVADLDILAGRKNEDA